MTLSEFKASVAANAKWFEGVQPETSESLAAAEQQLGVALPASLMWLLSEWGYSAACGIASLGEAIATTLRCRQTLALPTHYIVLNDWGDAGVVLLDVASPEQSHEGQVIWTATHNVDRLAEAREMDRDVTIYPGYAEWTLSRLEAAQEAQPEEHSEGTRH